MQERFQEILFELAEGPIALFSLKKFVTDLFSHLSEDPGIAKINFLSSISSNQLSRLYGLLENASVEFRKAALLLVSAILRNDGAKATFVSKFALAAFSGRICVSRIEELEGPKEVSTLLRVLARFQPMPQHSLFWFVKKDRIEKGVKVFRLADLQFSETGNILFNLLPDPKSLLFGFDFTTDSYIPKPKRFSLFSELFHNNASQQKAKIDLSPSSLNRISTSSQIGEYLESPPLTPKSRSCSEGSDKGSSNSESTRVLPNRPVSSRMCKAQKFACRSPKRYLLDLRKGKSDPLGQTMRGKTFKIFMK